MTCIIHDCVQGEPDWYKVRAGIPTASEFATVMAAGKDGAESKTRSKYLYQLAGEILTDEPFMEGFANAAMERGKKIEAEARSHYCMLHDKEARTVGFATNKTGRGTKVGASPDALIEDDGLLEIKTQIPSLLIPRLEKGREAGFPAEHLAQCQGALWVTEREWCDLVIYWPKLPLFVKRVYRDDTYIARLVNAVETFQNDLDRIVERMRKL